MKIEKVVLENSATKLLQRAEDCFDLAKSQHALADEQHDIASQQLVNADKQKAIGAQQHRDADKTEAKAVKLDALGQA